jgi:hypothetical protein
MHATDVRRSTTEANRARIRREVESRQRHRSADLATVAAHISVPLAEKETEPLMPRGQAATPL